MNVLRTTLAVLVAWLIAWGSAIPVWGQTENIPPNEKYAAAASELSQFIQREIEQKDIRALSIAVVDGDRIVWAQGFGFADAARTQPATAQTVYRVGSVSKLLSDVAVVQLIEQGKLKLDDDVRTILPDFQPHNPFDQPITLRRLMSHQSGLVREPPVGHYFDPTGPSLQQTVDSLNATSLVHAPGSRTKYSNAAVAVAGYCVQKVTGQPFADYMQTTLLGPLGMTSSSYQLNDAIGQRLAAAEMWSYDGRRFPAPNLQMGAQLAGNLYSTVIDLGQFMCAIFGDGELEGRRILSSKLLSRNVDSGNEGKCVGARLASASPSEIWTACRRLNMGVRYTDSPPIFVAYPNKSSA